MKITRRKLLRLAMLTGCAGIGLGGYAWQVEPRWITYTRHELPIPDLKNDLIGKTCIQLSDLHVGTRVSDSYLRKQFEYVRSLKPDFVFYTGDFVDSADKEHLAKLKEFSGDLPNGKLGTAGVLGNHDCYGGDRFQEETSNQIASVLKESGINILRNEMCELNGLKVGGLKDFWSPRFNNDESNEVIQSLGGSSLVLSHNPDTADLPIWNNYPSWILCGHTHGGQCRIPFFNPPFIPVKNKSYVSGTIEFPTGRKMYINRGVGHTTKVRFFARPEITVFTLKNRSNDPKQV